jgi:hypothetical protein
MFDRASRNDHHLIMVYICLKWFTERLREYLLELWLDLIVLLCGGFELDTLD